MSDSQPPLNPEPLDSRQPALHPEGKKTFTAGSPKVNELGVQGT